MKTEGKYYMYDWEVYEWVEVSEKAHEAYMKLLAQMHNIIYPKIENVGKIIIMGTTSEVEDNEDFKQLFIDSNKNESK